MLAPDKIFGNYETLWDQISTKVSKALRRIAAGETGWKSGKPDFTNTN